MFFEDATFANSKYVLEKFLIQTYPLVDFSKYYNVSVDWLCGKTKDSIIK